MGTKRAAGRTPRVAGSSSSSSGGAATNDAGADTPSASGSPAVPAPLPATSSPPLRGGPGGEAGPRPSAPTQEETGSTSPEPGNPTTSTCSYRQKLIDASISLWRDSDRSAEAPQMSVRDGDSDSSSPKRRKLPSARSYFQRFKLVQDLVRAPPDRVDKENNSTRHVGADTNISKQREGSSLIGKNKRHSSDDAVCRVSKRPDYGLHEASQTRGEQCSTPFQETGPVFSVPCTPTLTPSLQQLNVTQQTEDLVGASPERVDKENTSTRHVADTNISKQHEELDEASETRAEQCSTPFPETGPTLSVPCAPTLTTSLQQLNDTQQTEDLLGASPDRVDKENTSTRHVVADTNISKQCEGSSLIVKNKRDSSDAGSDCGLHEASETRAEQCSTPFPETGPTFSVPCTPTLTTSLQQLNDTQQTEVGASPDRVDKENTSTRHVVADTNISKQCEGSSLIVKNKRHSSDAGSDYGLHEASETRAEQCSTPFPETGPTYSVPCTPTLTTSLQQLNDTQQTEDLVGASPDRVDKENTSTRHVVADTNISKQCEGSSLIVKNKRHSSDAGSDYGLHEASETRVEQCSTPFPETGPVFSLPCAPTLTPSLQQLNDTQQTEDLVGASPERVDRGNTSTRHVADTNISKQCEGSSLIGKNKRHSSDAVCRVSKRRDYSLHEASETRAEQCSISFPETGPVFSVPCTPTLTPSLQQLNDTQQTEDLVGASPDRVDQENTSTRHVADTYISKLCEGSSLSEKIKRHSSDAVCRVSIRCDYGLHEASETRAEQCSAPFPETGPVFSVPCTPILTPSLNDAQQTEGVKELKNTPWNLHDQLEQELSILIKVLQLPDNIRFMAQQLFEYVLNNHQVVTEPVGIVHAFNIALCWRAASLLNYKVDRRESLALVEKRLNCECNEDLVALMYRKLRTLKEKIPYREGETSIKGQPVSVEDIRLSRQETSTNSENGHMFQNKEMDLHGKFTNTASQEISTVPEQVISERQEPVQETHRECHVQNDEITSIIVEKSIDLVGNVFSLREKNILCKQQLEISGLVAHRQNNVIRLKEVCSLVLEHIRRSHIDEMTRREKIKLTVQWFTMLMHAFLEHMKLQHDKLEGLQSGTWSSERLLKRSLYKVARSGQLDLDFDQLITIPDSNFVVEEFIHFKERNGECRIVETSVSYCQQLTQDELAEVEDEPEAEDQPDAVDEQNHEHRIVDFPEKLLSFWTSVRSGGGPASEALDFPENISSCSSDGIGVESAGCSSSSIPSNDDSIGQEASTSECRNTEHISLVGAQSVLPCMSPQRSTDLSAQPNAAPSRCPPVEVEHTGLFDLATQAIHDLQPEIQPSILFSDAPLQKMPDDISQTGVQPDRATGVPLGAAETSVHLGDARMQGQGKSDDNVAVDPVLSESPTCPADSPVTLQVSTEVETQTCESSMPAKQSTGPPSQQSILGTEAAGDLQPEVQPSTSKQDEPEEAEDEPVAVDEPEEVDEPAEAERAATLGAIAAQALQPEMQPSTSTQEVPFERSYQSGMPVLHSPTIHQSVEPSLDPHAGAEPVGMVAAHDLHSEILPSAPAPAEQNASLLAQQSLATSQHLPAEAEPAGILGTEPTCDLQPALGEVHDQPAEEQSCILGTVPLAIAESTHTFGSLTADDVLQPVVQSSASMQDRPAEAEGAVMLGSTAAQDLQAEPQSSTTVQHVPLERIRPEERRQISVEPNMVPAGHEQQPTQRPPPVTMLVSNNPVLSHDCLKNELNMLMQCKSMRRKDHEHKKALLLMECNLEIEKIKKKYASLLQKEDSAHLQAERDLDDICRKVAAHTSLAENFRVEMTPSATAQGRSARLVMQQPSESSSVAETAASPVTSSSAVRPAVRNPTGSHVRPSLVAMSSSPSPSWNAQQQAILYGHFYGTTSSPSVPAPVPYGNVRPSLVTQPSSTGNAQPQSSMLPGNLHGMTSSSPLVPTPAPHGRHRPVPPTHLPRSSDGSSAGAQVHASARLVQQLRMPRPSAVHTEQQQQLPAASPGVPVITASCASSLGGSASGPTNAAPASQQHAGVQTTGGSESASLNAHLPARLGLGSSPAASAEVVCLSDDES